MVEYSDTEFFILFEKTLERAVEKNIMFEIEGLFYMNPSLEDEMPKDLQLKFLIQENIKDTVAIIREDSYMRTKRMFIYYNRHISYGDYCGRGFRFLLK